MVPMAPSSTTMRSVNSLRSWSARARELLIGGLRRPFLGNMRPHTQRMADGVGELGTVQRVEMELIHAMFLQGMDLLDGHRRGDELARLRVLFEPVETMFQPLRNGSATALGEACDLGEARDGQDARHQRRGDSLGRAGVAETQEQI